VGSAKSQAVSSFILHPSEMSRILITSGPTRQYLDPVRYLTNASSGRMGAALAAAVIEAGHEAVVVSGPVDITYPQQAEVVSVQSTEDMLEACLKIFPACDGLIAAAAPCDYRPLTVAKHKIRKTGDPLKFQLVETPDVVATLGASKTAQWMVAFALETDDPRMRAMQKLERKNCDLIVVNGPQAVYAPDTQVEILDPSGHVAATFSGSKLQVARQIFRLIEEHLIH
jgi:phosphopantothenoylcysteine decarboxylase / phosphopantothenate---cysteine ligase